MRHLAFLATLFFGGAFLSGLIFVSIDIFVIGYFSQHSKSALLAIEVAAVLIAALIGAILFGIGLVFQRSQVAVRSKRSMILALACGFVYSALLALCGPGVLIRADKSSELAGLALFSLWVLPIGLAFIMRLSGKVIQ